MSIRRSIASTVSVALIALGLIAVPSSPVSAAGETAQLPTANPANFTPNVIDGEVDSIWQVGNTMLIGGTFTQVANATQNGGQVYSRTYLAAFDATTGLINTNFAPVLSSYVTTVIPAADGTSIYIGGDFNTVNGVNRRKLARINLSNGALVTTFNASGINGVVRDLRLVGSDLYLSGLFSTVGGQTRTQMATVNPTTGAVTTKLNIAVAGQHHGGVTNVIKMEVTPAGDKLMLIGNFTSVGGQARDQIAMLDLTTTPATLSPWYTTWFTATCSSSFDSYMRDLDISEDGTYAVVTTTGAYKANAACDSDSRFEINNTSATNAPTWTNYTGGDTSYAVEIHAGVAYIGGHMRWGNNPGAGDSAGQGAVPREGMMALDVVTGLPFSWNPGRDRGVGLFDYFVTSAGLWAGSDTDRWNDEARQKIAFFPWAGGSLVPASNIGSLPNSIFLLGRTAGTTGTTDTSVLYRVNAGGPALASADDGPDWAADNTTTSPYHNTGTTASTYALTAGTLDSTVPTGDFDRPPAGIFNTERYDPATGSEMQWNFTVPVGTPIQVRLYMANKAAATNETGERVFDVDLDGTNVINDIDLSNSPGHNIGTMRSFNIVSDGQVNILFRHGVDNPLIDAIEIVRTDTSNTSTLGTQDDVQRRTYDGVNAAGAATVTAGTVPWSKVRGSFMVNNTLYTLSSDGTLVRRTFDGTTFGPGTATFTYANGILSEVPTMTGIFFDPATSRIYYTLSGQSSLFYRSFLPEDSVIGAIRFTATGTVASLNPTRVRGMFLANGQLWFADNTTGFLQKIGFSGGAVTGTATVAESTGDWRARAMFLANVAQPNVPPTANFTSTCSVNSCTFNGATSTDTDGTVTGYAWTFGDTQTGTGVSPSHSYTAGGTYPVALTVTDNSGGTNTYTANVTVTDPPNVAPTASFTSNCTLLSCTFNAAGSTDSDGTISTYAWSFGDTATGTGVNPTHPYAAAGTYNVSLTVTDDDNAPATTSASVTVVDASAAAVYRGSAVGQGSSTSATVQVPAAVQVGDRLVDIVTVNLDTTLTTPAGWTLLGTQQDGTPDMRSWVFTRAAVAGTAGSNVTATMGAAGKSVSTLLAYSNAQAPTVLASSVMGASTTALATPAINVAVSGSAVINYWSDKSASNTGWVLPGTVTPRASGVGTGSGHITSAASEKIVTSGSWAAQTANSTIAGTKGIGWSIVVPSVSAAPVNNPPVAAFTSSCTALNCSFNAAGSSDSDGTIATYAWTFGDTTSGTGVNPSHPYASANTYTVTLTVTDDDNATNSTSSSVTVSPAVVSNVAFRASSAANSTTTAATAVVPASVLSGDQLVLFVTSNIATTITTPAGWTLLATQTDGSPDVQTWVFTRTAVAGTASSTVTATLGVSSKVERTLVAYSGADPVTVSASSVMGASSTALASPSIAVAENGSVVVTHWVDKSAGNTGWTLPASVTSRATSVGTGSGSVTSAVGDASAASGTYAGATANSSVAGMKGIAFSVVITPA